MGALYCWRHELASSRARDAKWRPSGRRPEETCTTIGQPRRLVNVLMPLPSAGDAYYANVPVDRGYPLVRS
jgi:hypothetical protein